VYGTFSGRVGSFTTESLRLRDDEDPYGRAKETVLKESQIVRLRKEMEALKVCGGGACVHVCMCACAVVVRVVVVCGGGVHGVCVWWWWCVWCV
jgi:hypothetical protein